MRSGWASVPFEEAVRDESGGNKKTRQSEFLPSGRFPIVDQGSSLIAGYTNDESRVCKAELPVIVFGDHTRCLKFIDFPFCMGADGTKVLRPRMGINPKYLFHYLRRLNVQGEGYSRHFKFLRRHPILIPPEEDQRRIADVLDAADAMRGKRLRAIGLLESLKQSIYINMFGDPNKNEHGYTIKPLIELVDPARPITYGILKPGDHIRSGVPYVRVLDMQNGQIESGRLRRTTPEIAMSYKRSTLAEGDVLLSIRGHVGRLAEVPAELAGANITQDTARLALTSVHPIFVMECLRTPAFQRWMARHTKGAAVRGINLGDVKRMPIPCPPLNQQEAFVYRVSQVGLMHDRNSVAHLQSNGLFASLQHHAFAGVL